jgi:hypothetical protein
MSMVAADYPQAVRQLQLFASRLLFDGGPRLRLLLTGRV